MSTPHLNRAKKAKLLLLLVAVISIGALAYPAKAPVISLLMHEPWEDMRQRSTARINSAIPGADWFSIPHSDARFEFADPTYGFITPPARFFTISYDDMGKVHGVRMSPQIEPLLLDDTLDLLLDLQDQWRSKGWRLVWPDEDPAFEDNREWRNHLREGNLGRTYWRAEDKYQVTVFVRKFRDEDGPGKERYLITLDFGKQYGREG